MPLQENVSLRPFNTFGFDARARYFINATTLDDLGEAIRLARAHDLPLLALGGGSNVVLAQDFPGVAARVLLAGREEVEHADGSVLLRVGAGENWHALVEYCVDRGLHGIENMALIPGTVGAAPIQNIGAYGVELESVFHELEALEIASGRMLRVDRAACRFGYRDSIFKREWRDACIVTSVTLRLRRTAAPVLSHAALARELEARGVRDVTARAIFDAVCAVRRRNLPDPAELGNAGSFFTNPVVSARQLDAIRAARPDAPAWPAGEGRFKLPAGWLIDQCGLKGLRAGDVGVFRNNALVLVNYGNGSAGALLALAQQVRAAVRQAFAVDLEIEPRVY